MSRLAAEAAEAEEVIITVGGGEGGGGGGVEINLHHKISFIGEGEDSFDRDNNNREGEREDEGPII